MKFSVLLPTRNRLEYLRYAVETVRRQDYADWEVVISDNCSEDDVETYVRDLDDERIRYLRTERVVPVTENWNISLKHCSGDYVVMLGDDDGLMPGYFSTLLKAFRDHSLADYVYVGAYFFAYKGAVPEEPQGFVRQDRSSLLVGDRCYWLSSETASKIVSGYLNFRMPVASNMQFSVISRKMIDRLTLTGDFFRSPFPDFYATPLLFRRSERTLVIPRPLVIVGITPKSYGAFHFSNRPSEGAQFLSNDRQLAETKDLQDIVLPGTSYYDSWLLAMECLSRECQLRGKDGPNHSRYRALQILHCYKARYLDRRLASSQIKALRQRMRLTEIALYTTTLPICFSVMRILPVGMRKRVVVVLRMLLGQHMIPERASELDECAHLLDVFEKAARSHLVGLGRDELSSLR